MFVKVLYAAGAFLNGSHYAQDEVLDIDLAKGEKLPLWAIPCDQFGNETGERPQLPEDKIAETIQVNSIVRAPKGQAPQKVAAEGLGKAVGGAPNEGNKDNSGGLTAEERAGQIKTALTLLEPENDQHWNADGKPNMGALESVLGFAATRKEVEAVDGSFVRPTK